MVTMSVGKKNGIDGQIPLARKSKIVSESGPVSKTQPFAVCSHHNTYEFTSIEPKGRLNCLRAAISNGAGDHSFRAETNNFDLHKPSTSAMPAIRGSSNAPFKTASTSDLSDLEPGSYFSLSHRQTTHGLPQDILMKILKAYPLLSTRPCEFYYIYMMNKAKLSVYILAYNEEEKIEDCVKSATWADEVVVIDSHSTDKTAEIAESLGAKVVQVDFQGFGKIRMSGIEHTPIPMDSCQLMRTKDSLKKLVLKSRKSLIPRMPRMHTTSPVEISSWGRK